eukprot:scaffold178004_cov20-Tisochrysis_lutea.AAC.4
MVFLRRMQLLAHQGCVSRSSSQLGSKLPVSASAASTAYWFAWGSKASSSTNMRQFDGSVCSYRHSLLCAATGTPEAARPASEQTLGRLPRASAATGTATGAPGAARPAGPAAAATGQAGQRHMPAGPPLHRQLLHGAHPCVCVCDTFSAPLSQTAQYI